MYKVAFRTRINRVFSGSYGSYRNLDYARDMITQLDELYNENKELKVAFFRNRYTEFSIAEYFYAKELLKLLENITERKTRAEIGYLYVYLTSEEDLKSFTENNFCSPFIVEVWKPDTGDIKTLLDEENVFILKEPSPYEFRVSVGRTKNPGLADWLAANSDKCKASDYALQSIRDGDWIQTVYFYLRDEKILLLVKMIAGNDIKKVERLVYNDNTDK